MSDWNEPVLMAIIGAASARSAGEAIRGGVDFVQVRAKELTAREFIRLVRAVITESGAPEKVLVNSRPDIAEMTGCRGVHLPDAGLELGAVRKIFPRLIVGVSTHSREGLLRAAGEGAHYALLGPIFASPGKEDRALGIARLQSLVRGITCPVIAVGGIDATNIRAVLATGAIGAAAIRPFEDASRARRTSQHLRMLANSRPDHDLL